MSVVLNAPLTDDDVRVHGAANPGLALWGISDGQPTLEMVQDIWGLIEKHGPRTLPAASQLKEPRPWQPPVIRTILNETYVSWQGARQGSGKSSIMALVIACDIVLGEPVAVALPSLKQGSRILLRRAAGFTGVLEPLLRMRRVVKGEQEKIWSNGGALFALSASEAGLEGTQGYTVKRVVIDESHEIPFKHLSYFFPLVSVAMQSHRGRFNMIGVGGDDESAPEAAKRDPDWATIITNDEAIIRMDDAWRATLPPGHPELAKMTWRELFAKAESKSTPELYDQFYRCKVVTHGARKIFDQVAGLQTPLNNPGFKPHYWAGIDAGKINDQSVVAIFEQVGECVNVIHVELCPLKMPYPAQARYIRDLIYGNGSGQLGFSAYQLSPKDIFVEVPGPGEGLNDDFNDSLNPVLPGVNTIPMTYEAKKAVIGELNIAMRRQPIHASAANPRFGIADIALPGGVTVIEHLEKLVRTVKLNEKGDPVLVWEHSDILSAILVGAVARFFRAGSA
ncbi:MAG TPA: hypothetical protein VD932_02230 [Aquabacterium sp.]|nr:hypothetical protein [Aquabacterium sp.]